ncbi:YtxH domain-containing protein [Robertmurraya sp. Marseille-Q9965]
MGNRENQLNEKEENQLNTKDFLLGALIGGIVGAATALFLTPKSGKDIREELSQQAITLKEKTGYIRETALNKGTELAEVAKERSISLGQAVSKQSNELVSKVKALRPQTEESGDTGVASTSGNSDIQRKLEETKKAFDETEQQLNH